MVSTTSLERALRAAAILPALLSPVPAVGKTNCFGNPCLDVASGNSIPAPGSSCKVFYVCRENQVSNTLACGEG